MLGPPLSVFTSGGNSGGTCSSGPTSTHPVSKSQQMPIRPIPFHSGPPHHFSPQKTLQSHSTHSSSPPPPPPSQNHHLHQSHPNSNSNVPNSLPSPSSSTSSNSSHGYPGTPFTLPNGISVRFPGESFLSTNQFLETRLREGKSYGPPGPKEKADGESESVQLVESSGEPISVSSENPDSRTSLSPVPFLQEAEIEKIKESALRLIQTLPEELVQPKVTAKRKAAADFEVNANMFITFLNF